MKSIEPDATPVSVCAGEVRLDGNLVIPPAARGLVLFAHGSGSGRRSPRNRFVAAVLQHGNLATLLFDLLSPEEERLDLQTGQLRFDIEFLTRRLVCAVDWAAKNPETKHLRLGLFGSSTGAAAALMAATRRSTGIAAVVSRGGRPDLAGRALPKVKAPTLLIVGGEYAPVIDLNRQALAELRCKTQLQIIPGATHLFEEPGTLERAAQLARDWFSEYLWSPV